MDGQYRDLIRWAKNGEQWAQASCDRLGLRWRQAPTLSPFTRRALSRELPAADMSGLVRQGGAL